MVFFLGSTQRTENVKWQCNNFLNNFLVNSAAQEPFPGWVDNVYGPTGISIGAGLGIIRVIVADGAVGANIVPVDLAVNGMIVSAKRTYDSFRSGDSEIKIYNYESVSSNPITWKDFMKGVSSIGVKV